MAELLLQDLVGETHAPKDGKGLSLPVSHSLIHLWKPKLHQNHIALRELTHHIFMRKPHTDNIKLFKHLYM